MNGTGLYEWKVIIGSGNGFLRRVHTFMSPCGVTRPQLVKYILEIDGLVQDNSNCIADALELLQPCTKSRMC